MGVHDFSGAIYSHGELEGIQCLIVPEISNIPIMDENELATTWARLPNPEEVTDGEMYQAEKEQYDMEKDFYDKELAQEEIPNPMDLADEHDLEEFGSGATEAILEIFIFPEHLDITNENFADMVKQRKYKERFFRPYQYSWDNWNFHDDDEKDWLNYYDPDDPQTWKMSIVWQMKEPASTKGCEKPKLLEEKEGQIWVRNFTKHGYDNFINVDNISPYLSNFDLSYVAYLFDIDYRGKTRKELFELIKVKLNEEFSFE